MATTPVNWSHINDPNRDKSPVTAATINEVINKIIVEGTNKGLTPHDLGYLLAMVNLESGFNPNAANPTSSASGLGQFIDSTGKGYGLNDTNRWRVDSQIQALVEIYITDKAIAEKNGLGEAGIYGAHHDGAAGVLKDGAPGIGLANKFVLPKVAEYEALVNHKSSSGEVDLPGTANGAQTPNTSTTQVSNGHWEDSTQYDAMGNVSVPGERIWVADAPSPTPSSSANSNPSPSSGASPATTSLHPTPPATPTITQISVDGTTANLPDGQVIHAGAGANLSVDLNGNLIVDRPASGWTNTDGSPSDIRQITTYDVKGQQVGTVVAQNLPGQSALIENGEERSITVPNADGTSTTVQSHFSAGTGWIDNQSGQTVLSLKDWQAQTDAHNAHLQPGPSADNDYQPSQSNGEAEAQTHRTNTASDPVSGATSVNSDFHNALLDAFTNPVFAAIKLWVDVQSNGLVDQGEMQSLSGIGITSINLRTGAVVANEYFMRSAA